MHVIWSRITMIPLLKPAVLIAAAICTAIAPSLATTLDGRPLNRLAPPTAPAVVLVFVATDCPISNRYVPEVQSLQRKFASAGVRFWLVYPNPSDTAAVVRTHNQQFAINTDTALDTTQTLEALAHVTTTPEAAIFVPDGAHLREVYHGRIDDRYIAFGQERPHALHHDLEDAIHAVLTHESVPRALGRPIGCSIQPLHS